MFAGGRYQGNTIGPCYDQEDNILDVIAGTKKRLIVITYPKNATVYANNRLIGETTSQHGVINSNYGSLF